MNQDSNAENIIKIVYDFFVESHDFNGILLRDLSTKSGLPYVEIIDIVKQLVEQDIVTVQAGHNPHIITFFGTIEKQIEVLEEAKSSKVTPVDTIAGLNVYTETLPLGIYPTKNYLSEHRPTNNLETKPFTRLLSLGHSQLEAFFFDIDVMERYSKDPRYKFEFRDYSGSISYHVDDDESALVKESNQIFLKTFGLGKDRENDRVAVVFLRYLSALTSEHQLYWISFQNNNDCRMYHEYYQNSIEGSWSTSYSVFSGYLYEQEALNNIVEAVFGVPLFNQTFIEDKRPDNFTFLFIPTLANYHDFILTLDKITSDNINKQFFKTLGIADQATEVINGKPQVFMKGTLTMLHEWLEREIVITEGSISALMQPFKDIRKERQAPAHKVSKNTFDKSFIEKQDTYIWAAYSAMRNLRTLFQKHPDADGVKIPSWLDDHKVRDF